MQVSFFQGGIKQNDNPVNISFSNIREYIIRGDYADKVGIVRSADITASKKAKISLIPAK